MGGDLKGVSSWVSVIMILTFMRYEKTECLLGPTEALRSVPLRKQNHRTWSWVLSSEGVRHRPWREGGVHPEHLQVLDVLGHSSLTGASKGLGHDLHELDLLNQRSSS